jgi:hypothetical protein
MLLKFFYGFRGLYQTAEAASAVSIKPLKPLPRPLSDRWSRFRGLYQAAETYFDDYKVDFLGEFKSIFETALAHDTGPYRAMSQGHTAHGNFANEKEKK